MAKPRKQPAAESAAPIVPHIGDKVTIPRAQSVLTITNVAGDEVNLELPGTNLQWFRIKVSDLTFVDRVQTSNPFTSAVDDEPGFDAAEITERIAAVQTENLQRLDDDVAILTKYLKGEGVPKPVISALESLRTKQRDDWDKTVEKITGLLED